MGIHIHIDETASRSEGALPDAEALAALLERAVRSVLDAHGIRDAEISVALVDDAAIAEARVKAAADVQDWCS